jgi:hypothetical protein
MSESTIMIVPSDEGAGASFDPSPLSAQQNDVVCWSNTTDETHQPWPLDSNGVPLPASSIPRGSANYLSDPIPPDRSSRPSYVVVPPTGNPPTWTLNYYCATHPKRASERGQISAQLMPTSDPT